MLFKTKENITDSYDVIIIGSGLAGMTAANKLAKGGRKVLLLESHIKLGGLATWFKRAGHVFDISLHGFPVGMLKTCKKYWSREIAAKIVQLKRIRFVNPAYSIESDFTKSDFITKMVENFGIERVRVEEFFKALADMNFFDKNQKTNGEFLEGFFPGRNDIHRFLLEPIVYANGSTLDDPAITYGIVFSNFMSKGVYTFEGGTDTIIGMMQEELLKNGVDIKLRSKVEKIIIEEGVVRGVELDGEKIAAPVVLSNSNLKSTIFNMAGEANFKPAFIEEAQKVRLNTSSCQVYMGIKKGESIPDVGDLIFYSEADTFSTDELMSLDTQSRTFSIYYPKTRPHLSEDRYTVVASTNARYDDWNDLSEADYECEKNKMIEATLVALEKLIPGVREKIDLIEAATPCTIQSFTHHQRGSSFGTKFEGLDISMNLHKEVDGLFHAGSVGIIMSGWLGAANYGVIKTHDIENYLSELS